MGTNYAHTWVSYEQQQQRKKYAINKKNSGHFTISVSENFLLESDISLEI